MRKTDLSYIQNWLKGSAYDIRTAKAMLETKRYIYVIFMCHLAVEKFLKGLVALRVKHIPPKTHDLYLLLKISGIKIPQIHHRIIAHLNETSIPTRYPEDISRISKQYNKKAVTKYLKDTESLLRWLKNNLK